jgi:S-adenosylmethionine:tRNA ribosyltransferase-isomerase
MNGRRLRVDDFDYELPPAAVAQTPAEPRDFSRLLVLDRATGGIEHARFRNLGRWLSPGDLLVVNDSRVLPARLVGERSGGGTAEVLALRPLSDDPRRWEALVRPSRRLAAGSSVTLRSGDRLEVGERLAEGTRVVRF